MKKLLILFVVTTLVSCNDFIDLTPVSQQNSASFYKNEMEMEQALTAAYNSLKDIAQYGGDGFSTFMEVPSDNTWNENTTMDGGSYASFDNFVVNPTNPQLERTWVSCFSGIQRCNIVISRLPNANVSDDFRTKKRGEALFLRALTYFNMVRIWGGVPLITEEVTNVNDAFHHKRATEEEVYTQIIKDLNEAIGLLPVTYDSSNVGRATKGAAQTLLGKVYLTQKDWSKVISLLKDGVISANNYKLMSDFSSVFSVSNKNNAESIFEVQFDKTIEGAGYIGGDPLIKNGDVNNLPSANLRALFEANPDDRVAASIINLSGLGWRMYKWHDTKGSNNGLGFNIIVLRYADVLLMVAEALNELKYGNAEALSYLNQVRLRSHAKAYTYEQLLDQESFRQAVAKERRLELAFENQRWFDLKRTGKAIDVLNNSVGASILKVNVQSYQLLCPIPQSEIDASSGALEQNPGYNK